MHTFYHGTNTIIDFPRIGWGEATGRFAGGVVGVFSATSLLDEARRYGPRVYAFELEEQGDEVAVDYYYQLEQLAEDGNIPAVVVVRERDEVAITDLSRIRNWRLLEVFGAILEE